MAETANNNIAVLIMAVERLAESQSDTNKKVDKLIESMGKQEVILEKLANIEKTHSDSVKRIYYAIDDVKERVDKIEKTQIIGGCQSFKTFASEYDNELKHSLEKIQKCEDFKTKIENEIIDIKMKPLKSIDKFYMALLGALGAGLGGYILLKIGVSK